MRSLLILIALIYFAANPTLSWSIESEKDDGCMKDGCHSTFKKYLKSLKFRHSPASEASCTICHNHHEKEAPDDLSLRRPLYEVCFSCHEALGEKLKTAQYIHAPVRNDLCESCHLSHGGKYPKLLRKWASPTYFGSGWPDPFIGDFMILCWMCHDIRMAKEEKTDSRTNFRSGLKNLHFVHLRKQGVYVTRCNVCHAIHASDQEFNIRLEVPFGTGGWKLPFKYNGNETGGSCVVGCHSNQTYDRAKKASNPRRPSSQNNPDSKEEKSINK